MFTALGSSLHGPRFAFWGVSLLLTFPLACSSSIPTPESAQVDATPPELEAEPKEEPLTAPAVTHTPGDAPSPQNPEEVEPESAAKRLTSDEPLVPAESYRREGKGEEPVLADTEGTAGSARGGAPPPPSEEARDVAGLSASGVGRGHGIGSGEGAGIGVGFGSGVGRLGGSHKSRSAAPKMRKRTTTGRGRSVQRTGVAAGEWDDNANFQEFTKYLKTQSRIPFEPVDVSKRRFLVVKDKAGKPVPNCVVNISDRSKKSTSLTTGASGRTVLFPRAEGLRGANLTASTTCQGTSARAEFKTAKADGLVALTLDTNRDALKHKTVDVVFILDTTGSMSEEIRQLKSTITKVADTLGESGARIRLGMVEYRDRGDSFLTRVHQMTTDVDGFVARVETIRANGGGDMPEDVNEGIAMALDRLNWNESSVARTAFLIGDAPPQLGYQDSISYAQSMKKAASRGIHLYTIAASGMDGLGQVVWRQIAQYTGGTNMFVLCGGAGPASVGGGDPKSSCGGTHKNYSSGNLSELIRSKVSLELATLNSDPMRVPGLFGDEKAKPCDQRLVYLDGNR